MTKIHLSEFVADSPNWAAKKITSISDENSELKKRIAELEQIANQCKLFLERMHYVDPDITIKESQDLHKILSEKLKEQSE